MNSDEIGLTLDELDTPALLIDLDRMERNIHRMVEICRQHEVDWRPHAKGHKSPRIARYQIEAGALGVTCAKLAEAEIMAAGGVRDILIANQIVGPHKMQRLARLCHVAQPIVAVDHAAQVAAMSHEVDAAGARLRVIIEVDVGLHRAGVLPGPKVIELALAITRAPGLDFAGIMGYEGHLLAIEDQQEKRRLIVEAMTQLQQMREHLADADMPCEIVSAGGTGSYAITVECPGITELQAGGLIFMDAFYRERCRVEEFEDALTVLTTVVSRPAEGRAIIDAGRKTHNAEIHPPHVAGRDDIHIQHLSAEHGTLRLDPPAENLAIGERLQIVPGYADFTCVLHDHFHGMRGGRVEEIIPLESRGHLR
jgi:D-serine deaminase-like pyridoxal phosphate-dependent protein